MKDNRLKLGDIFEIKTNRGYGYFQCVSTDKFKGELIKVFNLVFESKIKSVETLFSNVNDDDYYIGFPLKYAIKKKVVEYVDNVSLSNDFVLPRYTRSKHIIRGEFLGWHIKDNTTNIMTLVKELSKEQLKFSPDGIVNDTYLIDRLDENWKLEDWV